MPSKCRNKGVRVLYNPEQFQKALKAIRNGVRLREAAAQYGVPFSTLSKHRNKEGGPSPGRKPVLSTEDESTLATFIKLSASCGEGLCKKEILNLVQQFVVESKMETRWKNNRPGDDWFLGFMKRHPELRKKRAEAMSSCRVAGCDPFIIYEFYDDLEKLYKSLNIKENDGYRLYNCDETACSHDPKRHPVIADKGEKRISKNIAGTGKENTTILACGSADGTKLPPLIVFSGTYVWSSWISEEDYPGTAYTASKKGWMEGTLFCHWFEEVFLKNTPSKADRRGEKIVLFFDGVSCHINSRIVRKAIENDVVLVKLPPNVTQYLQPLDLCVFKAFKDEWENLVQEHNRKNSAITLDKQEFAKLLRSAWEDGFKSRNLRSGFEATGLFPLNRDKFDTKHFNPEQLERYKATKNENAVQNPLTQDQDIVSNEPATLDEPGSTHQLTAQEDQEIISNELSTLNKPGPSHQLEAQDQNPTSLESTASHQPGTSSHLTAVEPSDALKTAVVNQPLVKPSLSFETFVRTHLAQNNKYVAKNSGENSEKRKKVSVNKGEILTSLTALKRLEKAEKEKESKVTQRIEKAAQRAALKAEKAALKAEKAAQKAEKANAKKTKPTKKTNEKNSATPTQVGQRKRKPPIILESDTTSSETETDESDINFNESDDDEETFSDLEGEESFTETEKSIDVRLENYYAVYYDLSYYIGRVIDFVDEDSSKIKFLKSDLESLIWPSTDDIQEVENQYIFFGPINLKGSGPFQLKRNDLAQIKQKFAELKQRIK